MSGAAPHNALWLTALGLALLAGALAALWLRRALRRCALRRRFTRARLQESRARTQLERAGYRVIEAQPEATSRLEANGRLHEYPVRADYLVERHGRLYPAEAKSGDAAPRLGHAPTRRQLLEYQVAFGAEAVVLADTESGEITLVRWPGPRRGAGASALVAAALLGSLAGACATWWLLR